MAITNGERIGLGIVISIALVAVSIIVGLISAAVHSHTYSLSYVRSCNSKLVRAMLRNAYKEKWVEELVVECVTNPDLNEVERDRDGR
jgi:hypothetical protein